MGPSEGSIAEPLSVLAELKRQGLIRHIGLSNVSADQLGEAQTITEIVCVQNVYNVAHRVDDSFIDDVAGQGIAYVPFFPLGGFTPLQSSVLDDAAASLQATPMQVALAWLLQRSPNILLIPGTSSFDICARISMPRRWNCRPMHSPRLTPSAKLPWSDQTAENSLNEGDGSTGCGKTHVLYQGTTLIVLKGTAFRPYVNALQ